MRFSWRVMIQKQNMASELIRETGFEPVDFGEMANSWMYESLTGPLFDARLTREEATAAIKRLNETR